MIWVAVACLHNSLRFFCCWQHRQSLSRFSWSQVSLAPSWPSWVELDGWDYKKRVLYKYSTSTCTGNWENRKIAVTSAFTRLSRGDIRSNLPTPRSLKLLRRCDSARRSRHMYRAVRKWNRASSSPSTFTSHGTKVFDLVLSGTEQSPQGTPTSRNKGPRKLWNFRMSQQN